MAHFCWEEDLYKTYGMTFAALSHCDSLGRFRASDLPQEFADTCPRVDTLVDTINEVYGLYRRDCLWTSRLRECRELVGQQLLAVGEIMESLSGQMELNCIFLEGAEKELRHALKSRAFPEGGHHYRGKDPSAQAGEGGFACGGKGQLQG